MRFIGKKKLYHFHRVLAAACVIAVKYHLDDYCDNEFYSRVAGISLEQMNELEAEFLQITDYRLFVTNSEYDEYLSNIKSFQGYTDQHTCKLYLTGLFPQSRPEEDPLERGITKELDPELGTTG